MSSCPIGPLEPGLQLHQPWPPGIRFQRTIPPDQRQSKRQSVLDSYQNQNDYRAMMYVRAHRDEFETPPGGLPESPSTSPRHPKRYWERRFHLFKEDCATWASWIENDKAKAKTSDKAEAARLEKELDDYIRKLE